MVSLMGKAYECRGCRREFPIFFGIPDFRIFPDPYLTLESERSKAVRLNDFAQSANFAELVEHYYRITDDVPTALAPAFANYVHKAPDRSRASLARLGDDPVQGRLLDLGCGSGGALIAASERYAVRVGLDIGLRWLVIARKRLLETGIEAQLVCANAEALPFRAETFTHVLADDLIDNVAAPEQVLRGTAAVMAPLGRLWLSGGNRRWIGPHPATRVWAAGLLPAHWRKQRLERMHGFDLLRAVSLQTPEAIRRMGTRYKLHVHDEGPRRIDLSALNDRSLTFKVLAGVYSRSSRMPVLRSLLERFGPAFEFVFTKRASGETT